MLFRSDTIHYKAVSNSHERQNAVGISVCRHYSAVGVNSCRTKTQCCHCENAKLKLRVLNCSWTATTMLLLQTTFSAEIQVCRYLDALVDCWLPSTWACSQLELAVNIGDIKRQYERRINCKINAHMPSV